jgi:hypothetical protein
LQKVKNLLMHYIIGNSESYSKVSAVAHFL